MKYDFFIAGRWRNRSVVEGILQKIRNGGNSAYCFIENAYNKDGIVIDTAPGANVEQFMENLETIGDWQTNPTFHLIFENDMKGLRESREFILTFPAGLSAHMELGAAYGMGKKCYGIGKPEKSETLYLMFDEIFPNIESFIESRQEVRV